MPNDAIALPEPTREPEEEEFSDAEEDGSRESSVDGENSEQEDRDTGERK